MKIRKPDIARKIVNKYFLMAVLLLGITSIRSDAQTHLYFQDSPDADHYPYSWMELSPPSELERKEEPDLRRFPVESDLPSQQGVNCLRLRWRSVEGGDWLAIAAGDGWEANDISQTDTLVIWAQSLEGIPAVNLPSVFMEDVTNQKSIFIPLSEHSQDLAAGVWTRLVIPMKLFLESGDGVDYTQIKTIGFAQDAADDTRHTLLLDNMRVNTGDGTAPPVPAPGGVTAQGWEYHTEIRWNKNTGDPVTGYEIDRSLDGGTTFTTIAQVPEEDTLYIDWVKELGETVTATYRVKALNQANQPSEPSPGTSASTGPLTDDQLLDMVQRYTFRYFWDHAHPHSGLSRERNTSNNTVTSGGTGFGLMAIPVGIERGFITRQEGIQRILKMLQFLETADRFHGAWSHWLHGETGTTIPFSTYDNGGDIVETAYLAQGLLTIRNYFDGESTAEQEIVSLATTLWEGIEWEWYRRNGSSSIYWHWSPTYDWEMNMQVRGWNEAAIVYLLAIASPTNGVPASLWNSGWAASGYENGNSYFGHKLFVGPAYGGPLFFAHYSFLGFDPNDKRDSYANYFDQNRNHALIHQAYCEENPKGFEGYSADCWGLTASDDPDGYMAHEPYSTRDNGTITPTAALGSFPYTPDASMRALKHFYRQLGDRTWGPMGFIDAFNLERNWFADSYLAIDQGPILLMIENYRSGLLWDLFMANTEIRDMMDAIGFTESPNHTIRHSSEPGRLTLYPNPSAGKTHISFYTERAATVRLEITDASGRIINTRQWNIPHAGNHTVETGNRELEPGMYIVRLTNDNRNTQTGILVIE